LTLVLKTTAVFRWAYRPCTFLVDKFIIVAFLLSDFLDTMALVAFLGKKGRWLAGWGQLRGARSLDGALLAERRKQEKSSLLLKRNGQTLLMCP